MKALISAGGFGTRIRSASANVPKPMIKVDGVPVLERTIFQLKKYGIYDLIITVSYLKEQIMNYFGNGESFGVNIKYFEEDEPLGSAGAIFKLKNEFTDDFLVLNGDIVFDVDLNKMIEYHTKNDVLITLFAHPNTHPYDSTLICYDKNNVVCNLFKGKNRPKYYKNCVNAGIHILSPKVFDRLSNNGDEVKNFDKDLIIPLLETKKVFAYLSCEYVKDMGTPDRLIAVTEDVKSGKVEKKNIKNKQKAIFLDRDGTINKYVGFLSDINDFELIDNVADAIKDINKSDFLAIVITNQPVIARGEVTFEELEEIHKKMETLLGEKGAYVDAIYFCPHHPNKGFDGEVTELKIDCDCRKPKPGMILRAAEEFNIDLSKSYMIGDSDVDIKTAENAGCKSIKIECAEDFWKNFNIQKL